MKSKYEIVFAFYFSLIKLNALCFLKHHSFFEDEYLPGDNSSVDNLQQNLRNLCPLKITIIYMAFRRALIFGLKIF